MNILIASSAPPENGGGISTYCKNIATGLLGLGHNIHYASPLNDDSSLKSSWLSNFQIPHKETAFSKNMQQEVTSLLSYTIDNHVDVIINNDNAVAQNIAPLVSAVFISVCHLDSTTIGTMLKHNSEWTDYVVAISSDMQLNLLKKLTIPPHRIPLIYNGIEDTKQQFNGSNSSELIHNGLKVVYGGGLIPRKGGDLICKLLDKHVNDENTQFEIFGHLPNGVPTRFLNSPSIRFYGTKPKEEFLKAIYESDIFLLPSRAEGCPMALLEAISLNCLPITSDGIGAMRWIVSHAKNGYVCRLRNWVEECAKTLTFLGQNRHILNQGKLDARLNYEKNFTNEITAKRLDELFHRPTINRDKPRRAASLIHWHRWPNSCLKRRAFFKLGIIEKYGLFKDA